MGMLEKKDTGSFHMGRKGTLTSTRYAVGFGPSVPSQILKVQLAHDYDNGNVQLDLSNTSATTLSSGGLCSGVTVTRI